MTTAEKIAEIGEKVREVESVDVEEETTTTETNDHHPIKPI
jgi:hypothetical protein